MDIKKTLEMLYKAFLLIGTSREDEIVIEIYLKDGSVRRFTYQGSKKERQFRLIKKNGTDS